MVPKTSRSTPLQTYLQTPSVAAAMSGFLEAALQQHQITAGIRRGRILLAAWLNSAKSRGKAMEKSMERRKKLEKTTIVHILGVSKPIILMILWRKYPIVWSMMKYVAFEHVEKQDRPHRGEFGQLEKSRTQMCPFPPSLSLEFQW